jgi:hypothetical protein
MLEAIKQESSSLIVYTKGGIVASRKGKREKETLVKTAAFMK